MVGWGHRLPQDGGDELRVAGQLWTIAVVLVLLWLVGVLSSSTVGGFHHLLLPLALVAGLLSRIFRERAAS